MGLHTKVSNWIATEVDIGDAGVILQCLRQSLWQQVTSNEKGNAFRAKLGLGTIISKIVGVEVNGGDAGVVFQRLRYSLRR